MTTEDTQNSRQSHGQEEFSQHTRGEHLAQLHSGTHAMTPAQWRHHYHKENLLRSKPKA